MRILALVVAGSGCGSPSASEEDEAAGEHPVFTNPDFENDPTGNAPSGWTISANLNPAFTDTRPNAESLADLNLASGGVLITSVVGGAPESQTDPDLGTNGTFRFPKYGNRAARVNYGDATTNGKNRNVNTLVQTMTVTPADVDPMDHLVHVRFVVAPVLEDPAHNFNQQPYYFVRLQNVTTNKTLYQDFNIANTAGIPWKQFTDASTNSAAYVDWALHDIATNSGTLAIGDQVELRVIAAGCSRGGHWGRIYVDSFGENIPGLYTWGTGPQVANNDTDITYRLNYRNGGTSTTYGTHLDFVTPPSTTFVSTTAPGCVTPSVGATGTVTCPLGTLAPQADGSLTVTVHVAPATAAGTVINNGNYAIAATDVSPLLGSKVATIVTSGSAYSDVQVAITDGKAAVGWGQPTSYTITVRNAGPVAASSVSVVDSVPAQLTGVTWTCAAAGGATCTAAGSGSINDTIALPAGATATYTMNATVVAGTGTGSVRNTVTAAVANQIDPDSNSNSASDITSIGTPVTLTVTKSTAASLGTVSSEPAGLTCGTSCTTATGTFNADTQVTFTASPATGATFAGWSGACSGFATSCTVTAAAGLSVSARFAGAPASGTRGGGSQVTNVNSAFAQPLTLTVVDSAGTPVPGVQITFAAPSTGASATLSAVTATTDTSGVAQITATANATPGAYVVTATVPSIATPFGFALDNLGPPTSVAVVSGTPQSATVATGFTDPLVVEVRDAAGQRLPDIAVTFTAPGTGASATPSPTTLLTGPTGQAQLAVAANTIAGAYTVAATVSGVASPASFSLTNTAGAGATVAIVSGDGQSATVNTAYAAPLVVALTDAFGNPVPGQQVTFTAPASGATAALSTPATTDVNGQTSVTVTAGVVSGGFTISAAFAGAASATFTETATPGAPASATISGGNAQSTTVNTVFAQALSVTVRDAFGNLVPGVTVSFSAPGSGASASVPPTAITGNNGVASITPTAGTVAGSYQITASVVGVPSAQLSATNTPGAAAAVSVVSGTGQSAAVTTAFAAPLVAKVSDAFGNAVAGVTIAFAAPGSGARATLSAPGGVSDAQGRVSITATAGTVTGTYNVTASAAGDQTPFALTNTAGAAAAIAVVSGTPQTATVNTAFAAPLVVEVRDAFGNLVSGASVAFTAPGTGASATPSAPTASTGSNGRAQVTATAGTIAGAYAITATVNGQSTTFALTNTAGPAATVSASSGSPQSTAVNTAFAAPLVARVVDAFGNPVAGVTVSFSTPAGTTSAALSAATAVSGPDGTAQVTATARTHTGSYSATASASGAASATFALTNTAGPVASIAVISGSPQAVRVATAFPAPLVVEVRDAFNNPIPDATVTFAGPGAGAGASAPDATTGSNGRASATATAGNVAGSYTFTASAGGQSASFALTNLAGPASRLVITDGDDQTAPVLGPFERELEVKVTDDLGNPISGISVSLRAPDPSGPTARLADVVVTSGADGLVGTAADAGRHAGAIAVTASIPGATVTFHLTSTAGAPARVRLVAGGSPQAATVRTAFAAPLEVLVEDANGNPVSGATVVFNTPAGGATADVTASVTTDASGHARTTATANGTTGSYFATATVTGVDPAVFGLTNLAGAPAKLIASAGDAQQTVVDSDFGAALDVLVVDGDNNPVPNATVAFTAPSDGATAALAASAVQSGPDGHATVTVHASPRSGAYVVTAVASDSAAPAQFHLENLPDVAFALAVNPTSSPQTTTVATAFAAPLIAIVTDHFGNPVPGASVAFAVPGSGASGALSAPTALTDAQGRATVAITANAASGFFSVTATSGARSATFQMKNLAGAAALLSLRNGAQQATEVGTGFGTALVVRVQDRFGNAIPNAEVAFAAPGSGASAALAPAVALTNSDGEATSFATANHTAGSYLVTAAAPDGEAPVAFDLTNLPGPVASLEALALASPQITQVGHGFLSPIGVVLRDGFGNRVFGEPVTFLVPAQEPTGELAVATVTSGPDGVARTLAIAGHQPGTYDATVRVSDLSALALSLTNTVGPPAALVAVSGGGQHAMASTAFGAPVVLRVVDPFGNPVAGVAVTLRTPASGSSGTLSTTQVTSAADGTLSVTVSANLVPGVFEVTATADGTSPAAVNLTIDAIPTVTTIAVPDQTPVDQPITATITVTASRLVPQGEVELVDDSGAVLGHATLDSGVAALEGTLPARGHHLISARFTAQGAFGASDSAAADVEGTHDSGRLTGAGTDCNAGGGGGLGVGVMMALLFVRRRRALLVAAPLALALIASTAHAQSAGTRAIARLHPAAADSDWFAVDSVSFAGDREVSLAVTGDYAYRPLVIYNADDSRRVDIVRDQLILHFGASLTLFDRLRLSAVAPLYPYQDGDAASYNGMMLPGPSYAFGDVTLAGDLRVLGAPGARLRVAVGVRAGLPTGSKTNYTSDGIFSGDLHGSLAGTVDRIEYGAGVQLLLREETALAGEDFGSELRMAAAVGVRLAHGKLLVGPEAMAVVPVSGDAGAGHPLEVGLGLHYRVSRALLLGVGAGVGLVHAVGTPEERALASLAWNLE